MAGMTIDQSSLSYRFCPGKATWYPEMVSLVEACRIAVDTGILPREGSLEDQDQLFAEVLPVFVERWKERTYERVWTDVRNFTKSVLEGIFGKKKGK